MGTLRLSILLRDMNIPQMRRDTSKPENVRWLLRNLHVHNLDNASIKEAITLLQQEVKKFQ